jgi:hypothetical protein
MVFANNKRALYDNKRALYNNINNCFEVMKPTIIVQEASLYLYNTVFDVYLIRKKIEAQKKEMSSNYKITYKINNYKIKNYKINNYKITSHKS